MPELPKSFNVAPSKPSDSQSDSRSRNSVIRFLLFTLPDSQGKISPNISIQTYLLIVTPSFTAAEPVRLPWQVQESCAQLTGYLP